MDSKPICSIEDVPEGEARGFDVDRGGEAVLSLILAKRGGQIFAYENRCPHLGTPLDWRPDRLLDVTGEYLICATHGALFQFEDGHCLVGPCVGQGLRPLEIEVADEVVRLVVNEATESSMGPIMGPS